MLLFPLQFLFFFSSGCFPKKRTLKCRGAMAMGKKEILTAHFIFIEKFTEIYSNNINDNICGIYSQSTQDSFPSSS